MKYIDPTKEETVPVDQTTLDLMEAHKILRKYGWIQEASGDTTRGFCCAGAVMYTTNNVKRRWNMFHKLRKTLGVVSDNHPDSDIINWNDTGRRKWEEVDALFHEAITGHPKLNL